MSVLTAFFLRDFRVAWSYKFSFVFQNASLLFSLLTLRFISDLFGNASLAPLEQYGGDYFSFVLIGVGVSVLAYPVAKSFAGAVRAAQLTGTLEAMLTTRTGGVSIVMCSVAYSISVTVVQLLLMWTIGAFLFGAELRWTEVPIVLAILGMTLVVLTGVGLLSASFVIAFKQNEPLTGGFVAVSLLVSGIMYPTSVLPGWLESLAPLLPLTHAAELMRAFFIEGASASGTGFHMAALGGFCSLLPLGVFALNSSINHARRSGSLSQY